MELTPSEEDLFAAIVAQFETDALWRQVRIRFAVVAVLVAVAGGVLLVSTWGPGAAATFLTSFSLGAAVLFLKGGVLFRKRRLKRPV